MSPSRLFHLVHLRRCETNKLFPLVQHTLSVPHSSTRASVRPHAPAPRTSTSCSRLARLARVQTLALAR